MTKSTRDVSTCFVYKSSPEAFISPVFQKFFCPPVRISDEDSLSEIALSGASKLASTYFTLFYRSVHVLYTGICILGGCLC